MAPVKKLGELTRSFIEVSVLGSALGSALAPDGRRHASQPMRAFGGGFKITAALTEKGLQLEKANSHVDNFILNVSQTQSNVLITCITVLFNPV